MREKFIQDMENKKKINNVSPMRRKVLALNSLLTISTNENIVNNQEENWDNEKYKLIGHLFSLD